MSENVMAEELRCSICCDTMENPAMIFKKQCLHRYCYECIKNHANFNFERHLPSECPGLNLFFECQLELFLILIECRRSYKAKDIISDRVLKNIIEKLNFLSTVLGSNSIQKLVIMNRSIFALKKFYSYVFYMILERFNKSIARARRKITQTRD